MTPPSLQEWRRASMESTMRSKARRSDPQPSDMDAFLIALFILAVLGLAVYVVGWVL